MLITISFAEIIMHIGIKRYTEGPIVYQRRMNGTIVPNSSPFWGTGEPDRANRYCSQVRAVHDDFYRGLRDTPCTTLHHSLCERKITNWP